MSSKKNLPTIRSSAAEYLTFVAASGQGEVEAVYADEDVWLSQKMMGELYAVNVRTVSEHLKNIVADNELEESAVIRNFRITAADREVLQDAGKVSKEIAHTHALSEFEKYRVMQDRFMSLTLTKPSKRN